MFEFIQKFHSGWAYLLLLLLILVVANSALGFFSKKEFTPKDKKIALFALAATHMQIVIGFVTYFLSPIGFGSLGNMNDTSIRLTSLEHPLINIIAITLITVGWVKHKKVDEGNAKFKTLALYFGIGLVLILSRIPWALWF